MFVASDKHVSLQCDLYLEVSSKEYVVASAECVSRKLKNTALLWHDGTLPFGLQRNALASLVHFANKVNEGYQCIELEAREEGTIIRVVFLSFLIPALFLPFFTGPALT